ncbi:predicted protein [Phaeodactylum tricornutum CCAP 1055/1]|uniref:AP2/ERF domain-containing protein n=2 Tax=Phaeodactylum tricornutum TaxID=2850 RepID=B7GB75_PHATC|nr:predicted protein [Phaeodactylum tricornutum CCAP 1055/1]EEC44166.1 predicted protein [Phaeodactylum tricornutum CCAP 1055/1]|eukprot:XP_002184417.1 predicted protein [Phaeodactylum tricornutum CCAP 1055/1]
MVLEEEDEEVQARPTNVDPPSTRTVPRNTTVPTYATPGKPSTAVPTPATHTAPPPPPFVTPAARGVASDLHETTPLLTVVPPIDPPLLDPRLPESSRDGANPETDASVDSDTSAPKQVRFDAHVSPAPAEAARTGLVSRRGGRMASPARRRPIPPSSTGADAAGAAGSPSTVSSPLAATVLEYQTFRSPSRKNDEVPSLCSIHSGGGPLGNRTESFPNHQDKAPADSISCDPSEENTTSPLATDSRKDSVSFSPKMNDETTAADHRSTTPTDFSVQRLPKLDTDASQPTKTPSVFLSPSPSSRPLPEASSFEENKGSHAAVEGGGDAKPSPRHERNLATPTDFAWDYGRGPPTSTGSFDHSNVLAWLQSPTANGFFSPGGYGSIVNTPHTGIPRTPGTPTVSTSFFFTDVATLPRGNDLTPRNGDGGETPVRDGSRRSASHGISSIICISPLASAKVRGSTTSTPMNLKDVFASPREKSRMRGLPLLNDTPAKRQQLRVPRRSSSKDPSVDAVHLAERDLMEDEDLSVLLQLASNTPQHREPDGAHGNGVDPVFRSPDYRKNIGDDESGENLPTLQLPMIGNGRHDELLSSRLAQKSRSRDLGDADDFAPPPHLGMRSTSSSGSKEAYAKVLSLPNRSGSGKVNKSEGQAASNQYPTHPSYPQPISSQDHSSYYSMPHGVPSGPSGSMRISMGGPPPTAAGKGSPSRPHGGRSPHDAPHPYHDYSTHNGMQYPSQHPMYSQYAPYGTYPYAYPPLRQMPMYSAQHPSAGPTTPLKKSVVKMKSGTKRPLTEKLALGSAKKQRKSPSASAKKKNKSPQITDKAELQKAADAIRAVNAASGGKNDKAAALAAAILRGVTMRPSGKWQAQLYFSGKSRYIGVFDTREKAALAYEIAREKLKAGGGEGAGSQSPKTTENLVNTARKAAFDGVNEKLAK